MKDDRRRVSEAHEKRVASVLGAKQHKGSGSGSRAFDMHTKNELIECKTVLQGNKQITLKAAYLDRLLYQAAIEDLGPRVHISLAGKNWVLLPETDYIELTEEKP